MTLLAKLTPEKVRSEALAIKMLAATEMYEAERQRTVLSMTVLRAIAEGRCAEPEACAKAALDTRVRRFKRGSRRSAAAAKRGR